MTVVTPTDCPKSIRNRCVIEECVGGFVLSLSLFEFSLDIRDYIRIEVCIRSLSCSRKKALHLSLFVLIMTNKYKNI